MLKKEQENYTLVLFYNTLNIAAKFLQIILGNCCLMKTFKFFIQMLYKFEFTAKHLVFLHTYLCLLVL